MSECNEEKGLRGPRGFKGDKGDPGIAGTGTAGASAYDIWLAHGNVGTQVDFLNSLKGTDGSIGGSGLSAYQIWLANGHSGATVTDFLTSLIGPQGTTATVSIGTVTTGSTGTPASVSVDSSSTSTHTILNFVLPKGATGLTGNDGPTGQAGTPGPNSLIFVKATAISTTGYCVLDNDVFASVTNVQLCKTSLQGLGYTPAPTGNATNWLADIKIGYRFQIFDLDNSYTFGIYDVTGVTIGSTGATYTVSLVASYGSATGSNRLAVSYVAMAAPSVTPSSSSSTGAGANYIYSGMVLPYAAPWSVTAPFGFKDCDGSALLIADYPELWGVIGATYGTDGVTFNLPDYKDNLMMGAGGSIVGVVGSIAGSSSIQLSEANIPLLSHSITDAGHTHGIQLQETAGSNSNVMNANGTNWPGGGTTASATTGISIADHGHASPTPIVILNPVIGTRFIIKL